MAWFNPPIGASKDGIAPPKNRENRMVPINDDLSAFLKGLRAKQESYSQSLRSGSKSRSSVVTTLSY